MLQNMSLIDYSKCRPEQCDHGNCAAVMVCPNNLLLQEEPYDPPMRRPPNCPGCAKCVDACPLDAIKIV